MVKLFLIFTFLLMASCLQPQKTVNDANQGVKKFEVEDLFNYRFAEGTTLQVIDININKSSTQFTNPITYQCYYDQVVNNLVLGSSTCSSLPGLSFDSTDGTLEWTPGFDNYSSDEVFELKVIATDGLYSDSDILTIKLLNQNRKPNLAFISQQELTEESGFVYDFNELNTSTDVDEDGDSLSYSCQYEYSPAQYHNLTQTEINNIQGFRSLVNSATTQEEYNTYYALLNSYVSSFTNYTAATWYDCTSFLGIPLEGMSFNSFNGLLTWTPNKNEVNFDKIYKIRISVSDGQSSSNQVYAFKVKNINTNVEMTDFSDLTTLSYSNIFYTYENVAIDPIRFNAKINLSASAGASTSYTCYYDSTLDGSVSNYLPCSTIGVSFDTSLDRFEYDGSVQNPLDAYEIKLTRSTESGIFQVEDLSELESIDEDGDSLNFECYYDTVIDGSVANSNLCNEIGGNITSTTGIFNFSPGAVSTDTQYEIKININDGESSDSTIFEIIVRDKPKLKFKEITFGEDHSCALSEMGEIYCWGDNDYGQLGQGDNIDRKFPLKITSNNSVRFVKIKSHQDHTCALSYEGDLYCWGKNSDGQLGIDSTVDSSLMEKVNFPASSLDKTVVDFSVGDSHTCILNGLARVYCFGDNDYGQLGIGFSPDLHEISTINVLFNTFTYKKIVQIESGDNHTCAKTGNGYLYCWGRNNKGQLGNATFVDQDKPVQASSTVHDYDLGGEHTCYVDTLLDPYCFGANDYGQLGDGTTTDLNIATATVNASDLAIKIRTGNDHTCLVPESSSDDIICFGRGGEGQLGDGNSSDDSNGVSATNTDGKYELYIGENSNCLIEKDGLFCWGDNENYQFFDATTNDIDTPVFLTLDNLGYVDNFISGVQLGKRNCYTKTRGEAFCTELASQIDPILGKSFKLFPPINDSYFERIYDFTSSSSSSGTGSYLNGDGELKSYGDNTNNYWDAGGASFKDFFDSPVLNTPVLGVIAPSSEHSCYLSDGLIWTCSGDNSSGQLGDGTTNSTYNFQFGSAILFKKIVTGKDHTCGLSLGGEIYCSGEGREIGQGASGSETSPTLIDTSDYVDLYFVDVFAGDNLTCGISEERELYCFGDMYTSEKLVKISNPNKVDFKYVVIAENHLCALSFEGDAFCWGDNSSGQLGDGSNNNKSNPNKVTIGTNSLKKFKDISVGANNTCGVTISGKLYCWGENSSLMSFPDLIDGQNYLTPQPYLFD